MRFFSVILLVISMGCVAVAGENSKTDKAFGEAMEKQEVTSLSQAMGQYKKFEGKTITLEATPEKVCEKKGCWMVLKDDKKYVRTFFKDYGFFVPKDILGKKVRVQGELTKKHVSAPTLRHYLMDEGKKMEEVKKIKTGKTMYQFVATGVEII